MRKAVDPVTPKQATQAPAPPKPAAPIHIRAPESKSERHLVAVLNRAMKGRDRAMRQLVACNRAGERVLADLEAAGMITDPPLPKPLEAPKDEATADPEPVAG